VSLERLRKQIDFIVEIDKIKDIFRRTILISKSRNENDAEHSWHLGIMAILLSEYSEKKVNLIKVVKMVLIHDIVEIDAGDTYCYDEKGYEDKEERECKAAERIFNLLPEDQATELRELWDEFEKMETPEARFASALDRLQPLLHNYHTEGQTWKENDITRAMVLKRNEPVKLGSSVLWEYVNEIIEDSVRKGFLKS